MEFTAQDLLVTRRLPSQKIEGSETAMSVEEYLEAVRDVGKISTYPIPVKRNTPRLIKEVYSQVSESYGPLYAKIPAKSRAVLEQKNVFFAKSADKTETMRRTLNTFVFGAIQVAGLSREVEDIPDYSKTSERFQKGILTQLMFDAANYVLIGHAHASTFHAPIRNIATQSPKNALEDLEKHPDFSLHFKSTGYSAWVLSPAFSGGGYLVLEKRLGD